MRTVMGKNSHYLFRKRDPIFDDMRYFYELSGKNITQLASQTGLNYVTLWNWFESEKTKVPRHDSVQIFYRSFGIKYGRDKGRPNLRAVA